MLVFNLMLPNLLIAALNIKNYRFVSNYQPKSIYLNVNFPYQA